MLVKIATVVDKYELHETCEMFGDMWFDDLWTSQNIDPSNQLGRFLYLAYVFRKPEAFNDLTQRAILNTKDRLDRQWEVKGLTSFPVRVASKFSLSLFAHTPPDSVCLKWPSNLHGTMHTVQFWTSLPGSSPATRVNVSTVDAPNYATQWF